MSKHPIGHRLAVGLVAATMLFSGCAGQTGDITCEKFLKLSESKRSKIISKMLITERSKARGGEKYVPTKQEVQSATYVASMHCHKEENKDKTLDDLFGSK